MGQQMVFRCSLRLPIERVDGVTYDRQLHGQVPSRNMPNSSHGARVGCAARVAKSVRVRDDPISIPR
jgi:hypothetical protein